MRRYPRCKKCGKITEIIGHYPDGTPFFGCKNPETCGYTEYDYEVKDND